MGPTQWGDAQEDSVEFPNLPWPVKGACQAFNAKTIQEVKHVVD